MKKRLSSNSLTEENYFDLIFCQLLNRRFAESEANMSQIFISEIQVSLAVALSYFQIIQKVELTLITSNLVLDYSHKNFFVKNRL
jgi:hypothetical protein